MAARTLLIWGTGCEEIWRIGVREGRSGIAGFREVTGTIECSRGRLCLTNYESLTMAASYPDVRLPVPHQLDLVMYFPAGPYNCRIVQLWDPELDFDLSEPGSGDWLIELERTEAPASPWAEIPWSPIPKT